MKDSFSLQVAPTHDKSGKRVRYFADDDNSDLAALVQQEVSDKVSPPSVLFHIFTSYLEKWR
jgi:hypothetical protein